MNRVRLIEPARLEVLAEVGYYLRVEEGLGTKFLEAVVVTAREDDASFADQANQFSSADLGHCTPAVVD